RRDPGHERRSGESSRQFQAQAKAELSSFERSGPQSARGLRRLAREEVHGPLVQGYRAQHIPDRPQREDRSYLGSGQSQGPRRRSLVRVAREIAARRQSVATNSSPTGSISILSMSLVLPM